MAKRFEWANIKRIEMKRICIMYASLLMILDIEYKYCTWNSIQIFERSDNRGLDNQGSIVYTLLQ